jgi:hypothetical protein
MGSAFTAVEKIVRGYPKVQIYIHGYSPPNQRLIREQVKDFPIDLIEIDDGTFMQDPNLMNEKYY